MTLPLEGVYVQIATPSAENKFGGSYLESLLNTRATLEHFGAEFGWVNYPGCSDLCHARNKILDMFAKHPKATHLLKIDADMGWSHNDVIRMINSKRDFIAGVGRKKKINPEYCVGNYSDADGTLEPGMFKKVGDDLVGYVKAVGAGFVMITKQCALRMIHEYPDLMYVDQHDNEKVCAVYDPIIIGNHRQRIFDDFAFCYRWRKIGGVVAIFPDINLKHEGSHTFEGKWVESDDVKKILGDFNL